MAEHTIKLPDVGEGVAEAELVEWHVKVGDLVREDSLLAAVMTDKATVEIPSPVEGEIVWLGGEIGETIAVGSPIVRIKMAGGGKAEAGEGPATAVPPNDSAAGKTPANDSALTAASEKTKAESKSAASAPSSAASSKTSAAAKAETRSGTPSSTSARPLPSGAPRPAGERPLASPAVRLRAKEAGVDLRQVVGSGPAGRISHEDLDGFLQRGAQPVRPAGLTPDDTVEEIKIVGLRRKIAEKMRLAKSRIPHITYVEEIDVTALEELRAKLNAEKKPGRPKLTVLPFLMRAMVKAIKEQPGVNALFDDEAGVIHRHGAVHIGIAAQTPAGLMVPVVRHAEARDLFDCAAEINRLAEAAKAGTATREELSGSTITITSLGAMGGVATTPVINHPEVAIVGVNKIMVRPVWDGTQFIPRKMMNLSSSFDHRVVDGWDAAVFIQRIKALLETPAMIFVEG
ncbi:dihydrolipoamide acetyltransferase family protein [Mesorhizobium sp. LHD-90]|uniref:dihydrolipoamide acetyltransferase family protein n=1 Tax=Mesorhizobium sp. LHD-90 TaxID=3071414 RepID=UPI0027DEFAE1|nr:dihydrolipoamide acetyltransferase family protein [Mesorhizobium sp. LHD-90]MDQ6437261.1 dihydrolipoamide acetyltransferase family protein [Mesorhizobium sp. LHD-90]